MLHWKSFSFINSFVQAQKGSSAAASAAAAANNAIANATNSNTETTSVVDTNMADVAAVVEGNTEKV